MTLSEKSALTTADVAKRLDKSLRTVSRWIKSGKLKPLRKLPGVTGAYLFDPETVDALAAELARP